MIKFTSGFLLFAALASVALGGVVVRQVEGVPGSSISLDETAATATGGTSLSLGSEVGQAAVAANSDKEDAAILGMAHATDGAAGFVGKLPEIPEQTGEAAPQGSNGSNGVFGVFNNFFTPASPSPSF